MYQSNRLSGTRILLGGNFAEPERLPPSPHLTCDLPAEDGIKQYHP